MVIIHSKKVYGNYQLITFLLTLTIKYLFKDDIQILLPM